MSGEQNLEATKKEARRNKILGNTFVLGGVATFMVGIFFLMNNFYNKAIDIVAIIVGFILLAVGIKFQASKAVQDQVQKKNEASGLYDNDKLEKSVKISGTIAFVLGIFLVLIFILGYLVLHMKLVILPVFLILGVIYSVLGWNLRSHPLDSKKTLYALTLITVAVCLYSVILAKGIGLIWLILIVNLTTVIGRLKKAKIY